MTAPQRAPSTAARSPRAPARHGVVVVRGYGVRMTVKGGHLVVEDGIAADRRRLRFSRVNTDLRRLVVLGHAGSVSFDAIRWLLDVQCAYVHLDADGRLLGALAPVGRDDAKLRRAQALATRTATGLDVARLLLGAKLDGQAEILAGPLGAAEEAWAVREAAAILREAPSLDAVRAIEARVAILFWSRWRTVEVRFARLRQRDVPGHWLAFDARRSVLTGRNRNAVNPANAILNYLYGIGEAEARISLLGAGLDPGLGIVHADVMNRDSMALDLLEAIRPTIETYALQLLAVHTFDRADFFETRTGNCRLMPSVTEELAVTGPRWGRALAPYVAKVARLLDRSGLVKETADTEPDNAKDLPSLPRLLRSHPSSAERAGKPRAWSSDVSAPTARRCKRCGEIALRERNVYCDDCMEHAKGFAAARAQRELAKWAVAPKTRRLMGRARSEQAAKLKAWAARHPATPNPHVFVATIWPTLSRIDAGAVRQATGLSRSYCKRILLGRAVPHPMHWDAIRRLGRRTS